MSCVKSKLASAGLLNSLAEDAALCIALRADENWQCEDCAVSKSAANEFHRILWRHVD